MSREAFLYRLYLAAKDLGVTRVLRRMPRVKRKAKQLIGFLLPHNPVWVRVRAGLSQDLWLRLNLPEESRLWWGEHELTLQQAMLAAVCPGAVVYDIGAHVGSIALGVARLVGPSGSVVAFEAAPENAESLKENCSRNFLTASLQVVESAVWSYTADKIPFRRGGTRRSHGGVEADGQHPVLGSGELVSVPAITLDDFIANGGPIPQLVKIDVEGGEYEVLLGGKNLFVTRRPLVVAEVHSQQIADQIAGWLIEHSYSERWIIPNENYPRYLFAWPKERDDTPWVRMSIRPNIRE